MNKRIMVFLMALCLVCLTACGGNAGVDDTPSPSDSIEPTETPSESIVEPSVDTPTAPPAEEPTSTTEPTVEPSESSVDTSTVQPQEPTKPNDDGDTSNPTPTAETKPSTTTTTATPPQTVTPTQPPEPVHTHSYSVTRQATCTSEGIETCSCGETKVIPATGHTYIDQIVQGTGHYEQVQVGTKTVEDYGQVTIYGCGACNFTTKDPDEMSRHNSVSYSPKTTPCWGSNTWSQTKTEVIGTHEEPRYADRWVEDSPTHTIQVCSVCGHQQ